MSILINPILTLISIFITISISIFSDICWSYWGSYSSGPFYPRDRRDCFRMGPDLPAFGVRRHVRSNRQRCTYTTIFGLTILPSLNFFVFHFVSFILFYLCVTLFLTLLFTLSLASSIIPLPFLSLSLSSPSLSLRLRTRSHTDTKPSPN